MLRFFALALLVLPGCTIIDQRTFRATPKPAPVVAAAPAPVPPREGGPALVIIHPEPGLDLRAALAGPVRAALARKATVAFEVAAVVRPDEIPGPPDPGMTEIQRRRTPPPVPGGADLAGLIGPAGEVARVIGGLGVPATRIRLSARTDAGAPAPEVRVYVQ